MNTFVATVDISLASKMEEDLVSQGFTLTKPPYTLFSAQKNGVSCTLYASGKLTVQGKGKEGFITYYLEPEILRNVSFSYPEAGIDMTARIGVDEAGKGDFFGPLCIGAVQAGEEGIKALLKIGVKDSKQLSDSSVLTLAVKIQNTTPSTVVQISPARYNEMYNNFQNLNHLLAWGHATAIADLSTKTGCQKAVIDQFTTEPLVASLLARKDSLVEVTQRTKAESDPVVAAASILARAAFLKGLKNLSELVGMTLPKGASSLVVEAGRILVAKKGAQILSQVAKLHFKTYQEVLK